MRQAIMMKPGKIVFKNVLDATAADDEVLIRVKRIGVCGSDIHVYHGLHPFTSYPCIQGHEFMGVVERVGRKVRGVKPGMKATARPQLVCGKCRPCRRGDYNICDHLRVQGFQAPGCAQDLFAVPADRLVLLPDSFTPEQGALVEPSAVACHSTARAPSLKGRNVVVAGAGTIGNLVAQVVKARGAKKVLITDLSDFRLKKAKECGIANVVNVRKEPLVAAAGRVFGKDGFDVAFECVGAEPALAGLVGGIAKGGTLVVLGVFGKKPAVDMSVVGDRELSLVGTLMYKHEDYLEAVAFIRKGAIRTEPLVTAHFPFPKYPEAYRFIETRQDRTLKVMIDL